MEGKTDNSQKKEEHDSLKPARDAIAIVIRILLGNAGAMRM